MKFEITHIGGSGKTIHIEYALKFDCTRINNFDFVDNEGLNRLKKELKQAIKQIEIYQEFEG